MSKFKTAILLGIFSILSGILNYLTYPILIHHLSIADYAEFSVYTSLSAILSIPTAGFGYYMMVEFRKSFHTIQEHRQAYFQKIYKYTLVYALIIMALGLSLFVFLGLKSYSALFLVLLALIPGLLIGFYAALLQARELFVMLGVFGVVTAFLRFGSSYGVVWIPSVWMAILPFTLPPLLIGIFYLYFGKKEFTRRTEPHIPRQSQSTSISVWNYIIIIAVIILLQNVDVILVKMLFSDYDVTLYASVAVIAKFALIIIAILETIFTPGLVDIHKGHEHRQHVSILIGLSILGYVVALTFLPWAGNIVLHILKPELSASWWLWSALGVAMVSLGFFSLFSKIVIAWGGKIFMGVFVLCGMGISLLFSKNLEIFSLIIATTLCALYIFVLFKTWKNLDVGGIYREPL